MATHSSILAWTIPMDRGVRQADVHGVAESDTTAGLSTYKQMRGWQTSIQVVFSNFMFFNDAFLSTMRYHLTPATLAFMKKKKKKTHK